MDELEGEGRRERRGEERVKRRWGGRAVSGDAGMAEGVGAGRGGWDGAARAGLRKVFILSVDRHEEIGAGVGSDRAWLLLGADKAERAGVGWAG